jgi:phosphoribosylamine--glycine ligase
VDERLSDIDITWHAGASCCVVMASGGYPGSYEKGYEISGLSDVPSDITVFHAGTTLKDGKFYTNGGRILDVTACAASLPDAVRCAYEGVGRISFKDAHYRTDIGRR